MKVVNLKQAILQAWKERWSDYQWAINMKKFFPRGATWDILNLAGVQYNVKDGWGGVNPGKLQPLSLSLIPLAEALLEQAMIGPSPNPLILSYLKYSISSQVNIPIPQPFGGKTSGEQFSVYFLIRLTLHFL